MTLRIALLVVIAAFAWNPSAAPVAFAQQPGLSVALNRYAAGGFDEAVAVAMTSDALRRAGRWSREWRDWVGSGDVSSRTIRTRTAAAFALEVVARSVEGTVEEYAAAGSLLETACEAVRQFEPDENELLFHLAAVALLQGAHDDSALLGPPRQIGDPRLSHIRHAAARTPHSRLKLAWVTERYALKVIGSAPQFHGLLNRPGRWDLGSDSDTRELRGLMSEIGLLADDPVVGSEARLRRGVLAYLMQEQGEGAEDFRSAAAATDQAVSYLAHMMLGIVDERHERLEPAIAQYRAARAIVAAPSAITRLSAALFMNGQAAEAADVSASVRSAERFADPWHLYSLRDYRFWPAYRAELRLRLTRIRKPELPTSGF